MLARSSKNTVCLCIQFDALTWSLELNTLKQTDQSTQPTVSNIPSFFSILFGLTSIEKYSSWITWKLKPMCWICWWHHNNYNRKIVGSIWISCSNEKLFRIACFYIQIARIFASPLNLPSPQSFLAKHRLHRSPEFELRVAQPLPLSKRIGGAQLEARPKHHEAMRDLLGGNGTQAVKRQFRGLSFLLATARFTPDGPLWDNVESVAFISNSTEFWQVPTKASKFPRTPTKLLAFFSARKVAP